MRVEAGSDEQNDDENSQRLNSAAAELVIHATGAGALLNAPARYCMRRRAIAARRHDIKTPARYYGNISTAPAESFHPLPSFMSTVFASES